MIWDLDKTYLATEFESFWGLLKVAFEAPEKKKNISGAVSLLKHLRVDTARASGSEGKAPLFFVSASPPQMQKKIEAKLRLDGIDFTHVYYKNQLKHVRRGQFGRLREHVGYKLIQMLRIWFHLPKECGLILFGDDSEDDALTYSLFIDVLDRTLMGRALYYLLQDLGIHRQEAAMISRWQRDFPKLNPVRQIYIHLIKKTDPQYYQKYGNVLAPTKNAFQIALSEYFQGRLSAAGVSAVAYEMHVNDGMTTYSLRRTAEDIIRRRGIKGAEENPIWTQLVSQKLMDEIPNFQSHGAGASPEIHRDPIPSTNEQLKVRMKYYEDLA